MALKKKGLGRGLDALLSDNRIEDGGSEKGGVTMLRTADIEPNPKQARRVFDKEALDELTTGLEISCNAMELILEGSFSHEKYNKIKTDCLLEDRSKARARRLKKIVKAEDEPGVVNEALREKLQEWRTAQFKKENVPAYRIMHQSTLMTIASVIPQTKSELMRIKGFGEESFRKYGEDILAITSGFAK